MQEQGIIDSPADSQREEGADGMNYSVEGDTNSNSNMFHHTTGPEDSDNDSVSE